jgi:hypothetical protein
MADSIWDLAPPVKGAQTGSVWDLAPAAGKAPVPPRRAEGLYDAVVAGVQKAGIAPERFAGGHGGVANYGDLASRAGK